LCVISRAVYAKKSKNGSNNGKANGIRLPAKRGPKMCDKKKKKRLNYIIIKKILTKIDESCNFQSLGNTSRAVGWRKWEMLVLEGSDES